jgi:hypothetical protein
MIFTNLEAFLKVSGIFMIGWFEGIDAPDKQKGGARHAGTT